METIVALPEKNEHGINALERAKALTIVTNEDYTAADNFCVGLKGLEKEIDAAWDSHIATAFQAHRALVAKKKIYAEPVDAARRLVKGKMAIFADQQEKLRREEESRLQAEANKRAEEQAIAEAEAAQKAGDTTSAEAIISAPVVAAPVVLARTVPKAATPIRKMWDVRVFNPLMVPRQYLMVNDSALKQQVRATGDTIKIPGCEIFQRSV